MEKEVLKEKYITVLYHVEYEMAKFIWHGNPNDEEYRKPFYAMLEWVNAGNPMTRFYSDTRNQGIVKPEHRKWFENEMLPAAINAGLKKGAVVMGGNAFKRYYMNMILSAVNKFNMPLKLFGNEEDAVEFLIQE